MGRSRETMFVSSFVQTLLQLGLRGRKFHVWKQDSLVNLLRGLPSVAQLRWFTSRKFTPMFGLPRSERKTSPGRLRAILALTLLVAGLVAAPMLSAQISVMNSGATSATTYSLGGAAYAQNFDALPASGTVNWVNNSTLPGWYVASASGTVTPGIVISNGGSNLDDQRIASVGVTAESERALAYQTKTVTTPTYIGVGFANDSGRELTSFSLAYVAEQWREIGSSSRNSSFTVQYRVGADASALNATTGWTTVNGLSFTSNASTSITSGLSVSANLSSSNVAVSVPPGSSIWFRWVMSNNATTANTSNDIIAIDNVSVSFAAAADGSPAITTHPVSQSVTAGDPVTFTVVATGDAPLAYQWSKGGADIPGATSASYTITSAAGSDAGSYTVTVSNDKGSATSAAATLTVDVPVGPAITSQPASLTVDAGQSASFTVVATGSAPLAYQWTKDGADIPGATSATYTINVTQVSDSGSYAVRISNSVDTVTSNAAALTVQPVVPVAPSITTHPASRSVFAGGSTTFTVVATGTVPLSYQWQKNGNPIHGATSSSYTISNVTPADAGNYRVAVTNSVSTVTSNTATLTISASIPLPSFNLTGFATVGTGTTGGGVIPETDPAYRKVSTPLEFVQAIIDSNKTAGRVKVIEIMADLDLGWIEVGTAVQTLASNALRAHAAPKLHPKLIQTGVSILDIKSKSPLTIFSAHGATIRHVNFNIKDTSNIIIRNLRFDELWEWDEASKGDYDSNDWDFITISNGGAVSNVWIDHCTFTKAYDGIIDMKVGSKNVTVSWCRIVGDDGATNPNSFVRQQLAALEANKSSYAGYRFLRDTVKYTVEDIAQIIQGHDKGALMGATSLNSGNAALTGTFHHIWFHNVWDRVVPRLRGGNVHNYNIYVDDVGGLAARRLRDAKAAANLTTSQLNSFNNGSPYKMRPFLNGTISTENGAILVEKSLYSDCLTPLRNNQTDPTNSVYTGKIVATDTIYRFNNADGTVTEVRGNSTDPNNPLGPFQAAVIPFSWNLPNNELPYTVTSMDDPATLPELLEAGAGAGVLNWSKENWLRTTYVEDTTIPPSIVVAPESLTVAAGADTTFTVQAAGSPTLTYQWKKGGVNLTEGTRITGTTSAVLTVAETAFGDAGDYTVTVANHNGSVTSAPATLTVVAPTAPGIAAQPVAQTVFEGHAVQFSVAVSGSAPFSYQWRKDGADIVGATGAIFEIEFVQPGDAGSYSVVVSNLAGSVTSESVTLTVTPTTSAPVASAATVVVNNAFTANWSAVTGATNYRLDVSTTNTFGTFVPGYQDVDVGDTLTHTVVGLSSGTTYFYRVRAVGPGGTSAPSNTIMALTAGTAATNVDVSQLTWYQTRTADSVAVDTTAKTVTFTEGQSSASGYITHLPSPVNVAVGQTLTVTIHFETGTVQTVGNALRFGIFNANGTRIAANANSESNEVFYDDTGYMVSYNLETGVGTLYCRVPGTSNGTLMGSTAISPVVLYQSASASLIAGAPAPIASSSVYSLTLTLRREAGAVFFTSRLNGGATMNYLLAGADESTPSVATASFDEFAVRVAGGTGSLDKLKLTALQFHVEETISPDEPPVITAQPQSQTVNTGAPVTFSVTATGANLTYQWRRNGAAIEGATGSSYTIANTALADAGTYDVVVTNPIDSVTSSGATLTVNVAPPTAPTITTQPQSIARVVGSSATFTVQATGTPPLAYQWFRYGVALSGQTGSTLAIGSVQAANAGEYHVTVSNDVGTATSAVATLTVTSAPDVTHLADSFADGNRTGQNLPNSAAWFTSTASNTSANASGMTMVVSSSRTALAYFTGATATPVTLGQNQRLTAEFVFQYTGFDTLATAGSATLVAGLFQSVANPTATTDAANGFTASGSPNTNARVTGDFGSGQPASGVFADYTGYAAAAIALNTTSENPISFRRRDKPFNGLLNSLTPYTVLAADAAPASLAMSASTDYRGTFSITRTAAGHRLDFRIIRVSDSAEIMAHSTLEPEGTFTTFDTFGVYVSKAANSANYNFTLKSASVVLGNLPLVAPPGIATQPANLTVAAGAPASFQVAAVGAGPFSYQWRKGGVAITGATGASYTIPAAAANDAGDYDVVVTNEGGATPSATARLTVTVAGYDAWAADYFDAGQLANPQISGPLASAAGDGVTNLFKYALGCDPRAPLPGRWHEIEHVAGGWVFVYQRPTARADISYTVEVSSNLTSWSDANVIHELESTTNDTQTWRAIYVPPANTPNVFFRLKVTR